MTGAIKEYALPVSVPVTSVALTSPTTLVGRSNEVEKSTTVSVEVIPRALKVTVAIVKVPLGKDVNSPAE